MSFALAATSMIFHPAGPLLDDYESARINGEWWQARYDHLVRPRRRSEGIVPADEHAILAELYRPDTADFLHGSSGPVPFLVSAKARAALENANLGGFATYPVTIIKIATKGKRRRQGRLGTGEPGDEITKGSNQLGYVDAPSLFSVWITATVAVVPDHAGGVYPNGRFVCPFELPTQFDDSLDLWRPCVAEHVLPWSFCSERFKRVTEDNGFSNILFVPFTDWIADFRAKSTSDGPKSLPIRWC